MNSAKLQSEAKENREVISSEFIRLNQEQQGICKDYAQNILQHTSKWHNFTASLERTHKVISGAVANELRDSQSQKRTSSQMNRVEITTRVYSQGSDVHLTTISSEMEGHIPVAKNLGDHYDR